MERPSARRRASPAAQKNRTEPAVAEHLEPAAPSLDQKPGQSPDPAAARALRAELPPDWRAALEGELRRPSFVALAAFVAAERARGPVFPPAGQVFTALHATPLAEVRVVILGQDPYHRAGQAHGLSFSVPPEVALPPSLRNVFKELTADLRLPPSAVTGWAGDLSAWAAQGVLLLNTVLTVRAGAAGSHRGHGWERFTDAILAAICRRPDPRAVFVLWGGPAQQKAPLLTELGAPRDTLITAAHPSPLSAHAGFFGSRPFSAVNAALRRLDLPPIAWRLPDAPAAQGVLPGHG